jgi:hypothetical protein
MDKLEQIHIDFLRTCADNPNKIHSSSEIPAADLEQMANEGLLIKYHKNLGNKYAISHYGSQYIKAQGSVDNPEMRKLAMEYVISKGGYTEAEAEEIVARHGIEAIFQAQSEERQFSGQREVKVPTDDQGKAEIKFRG